MVEHRSAESEGRRFDSLWERRFFSLSHARDKTKKNISLFSIDVIKSQSDVIFRPEIQFCSKNNNINEEAAPDEVSVLLSLPHQPPWLSLGVLPPVSLTSPHLRVSFSVQIQKLTNNNKKQFT